MNSESLVVSGVMLAIVALLVRFGGNNAILAGSKDSGVKDMAKLNRWAGNRFLLLPIIAFALAAFSSNNPALDILGMMLLFLSILGVIIWISIGSRQFK